ncbi:UPF0481 protein At3g47200-like [Magnolia sinica]|uniref:UPF0481 protein At3g47200-like n=1 Tax=Magnolia sinica TaxID=86752 RepID=UPI0026594330|nr:UPF0481 protein At3g47200-like [Magnolia sinica]
MDGTHEIEVEEANTSTNDAPRRRCLTPGGQALADSMLKSVNASISKLRSGNPPTIYIVPQRIRQVNEVAYEPQVVSIGPYHNGKERVQGMEEHKWMYLHSFLSRNRIRRLEDYLEAIEELEDEARSCYSEKVGPQMGNEFVKMMMLDGCFIVEFFLKCNELRLKQKEELDQKEKAVKPKEKELKQKDTELNPIEEELSLLSAFSTFSKDAIFNTTGMVSLIGYDMLLLENQIPFSILQRIFIMARPIHAPHMLAEMALDFFDQLMPRNKEIKNKDTYLHLLHLFHSHLITTPTHKNDPKLSRNSTVESVQNKETNLLCNPTIESVVNNFKNIFMFFPSSNKLQLPISNNNPSPVSIKMIPCAAELQLAGVKFKKKDDSSSILDVKFSHGVLEIPPLSITDSTNTLFRNLVAFEQCYRESTIRFTTYFWFMDCLVNTSKDVALLHRKGIIVHWLGSDEDVAYLFNRLCIGIFHNFDENYLLDLHQNVQKHCKNQWNMWRASLRRDYFTNPWSVISLIAASILLLVTITQTFFTVFPYYRPRS